MKMPLPSDIPFHSVADSSTADPRPDFVYSTIKFCENSFRIVGFFVYTCLAFGLMAATCHQSPFLWLFVFFLGFLFWLYVWNVTLGIVGLAWARRRKTDRGRKRAMITVKSLVIGMSVFCFVFVSFEDLIDAYVLRLFPEAQSCDMYGGTSQQTTIQQTK